MPFEESLEVCYAAVVPEFFNTLSQNKDFVFGAYNFSGALGLFFILGMIDTALKAWGMWRAARLNKKSWFLTLVGIPSLGILPLIFLLLTNQEYKQWMEKPQNLPFRPLPQD